MPYHYPRRPTRLNGIAEDAARKLLEKGLNSVAIYTAYSKPVVYSGADLANLIPVDQGGAAPPGPPGPPAPPGAPAPAKSKSIAERLKPTVIIDTAFGRKVIAPFGEATPDEHRANIRNLILMTVGVVALYSAGFFYLGYKTGQRRAKRGA